MSKLIYCMEAMSTPDGTIIKNVQPDADGYYCNWPMAVGGITSRNNTMYTSAPIVDQIENPTSNFHMACVTGNQFGEYGHPDLSMYNPQNPEDHAKILQRLGRVDEERSSHHFRGLPKISRPFDSQDKILISADFKPVLADRLGRRLDYLIKEKYVNVAFSLRAFAREIVNAAGIRVRSVTGLRTFDAVNNPGFIEASQRNVGSLESLDYEVGEISSPIFTSGMMIQTGSTQYALESVTDTELNDVLKTSKIIKWSWTAPVAVNNGSDVATHDDGTSESLVMKALGF